jgi:hypothetical protein
MNNCNEDRKPRDTPKERSAERAAVAQKIREADHMAADDATTRKPENEDERKSGVPLNFYENFIARHYLAQPNWVRTFVFMLFTLVLVYGTLQVISGVYVYKLKVVRQLDANEASDVITTNSTERIKGAVGYTILVADRSYGLDREGDAHVFFSSSEVIGLLAKGRASVRLIPPDTQRGYEEVNVKFDRLSREFDSIRFKKKSTVLGAADALGPAAPILKAARRGLFSAAYAAEGEAQGSRLFIRGIAIPANAGMALGRPADSRLSVSLQLDSTTTVSLKGFSEKGEPNLPVSVGATRIYDLIYFLPLPQRTSANAIIEVESPGYVFQSARKETFPVPNDLIVGEQRILDGSLGSKMTVQKMSTVDVTIFIRIDSQINIKEVMNAAEKIGFVATINSGASGIPGKYNSIYVSPGVSFRDAQIFIKSVSNKVDIKFIQFDVAFKSGVKNQIQLGSNSGVACLPSISSAAIGQLAAASSSDQFKTTLRRIVPNSTCPGG